MQHSSFDKTGALVLAAGKGTRMHSDKPKVLQRLLEEPMLAYVLRAAEPLFGDRLWTVIGHGAEQIRAAFPDREGRFILQERQLGTGHALQEAWPTLKEAGLEHVLVVNGDSPLVTGDTLRSFLEGTFSFDADLAFITLSLDDPGAFGRVVRNGGEVAAVIEAKDYDESLHGPATGEINAGVYCLKTASVEPLLARLDDDNQSGELYITDLIGLAVREGLRTLGWPGGSDLRLLGVNSPAELVRSEEFLRAELVDGWLNAGVIIHNPSCARIGPTVDIAKGAEITGPCEIYGNSRIAAGVRIDSHCRIADSSIRENAVIRSYCHIEGAKVGADCVAGPYARIRPASVMENGSHIGNFVEIKNVRLGEGAKANHLSYIGDAEVGAGSNIGAGTITCNYDGKNKHRTRIGKKAFIGSNSALVAPVSIGEGALVGAGSVITKDVPDGHLGIGRGRQKNIARKSNS